jgi:hypothetical protein
MSRAPHKTKHSEILGWKVHRPGQDPELDEIVYRRFGRDHKRPCRRPEVTTCALWACQFANACQSHNGSRP